MSGAGQKITQAHEHLAKAVGILSIMIVKKKITRDQLQVALHNIKEALKIIQNIG